MIHSSDSGYTLDEAVGFVAEQAVRALRRELRRAFKKLGYDVTPYQFILLYRLWEQEGLSQSEIAERTIMDEPAIVHMIDILEKQGLVVRQRSSEDRRRSALFLTEGGKKLAEQLPRVASGHLQRACAGIKAAELEVTKRTLRRIVRNLEGP